MRPDTNGPDARRPDANQPALCRYLLLKPVPDSRCELPIAPKQITRIFPLAAILNISAPARINRCSDQSAVIASPAAFIFPPSGERMAAYSHGDPPSPRHHRQDTTTKTPPRRLRQQDACAKT